MLRTLVTVSLLTLAAGTGCGGSEQTGDPTLADMGGSDLAPGGYPAWDAKNPAICGQSPYTWQPAANVGQVLDFTAELSLNTIELFFLKSAAYLGSSLSLHHSLSYNVQSAVIHYQTQDRGQLVDATAMVTWPTATGKTYPITLFLHPTLGYTDSCAPSASAGDITAPMTVLSLITASSGYVGVFPDYLNERSKGGPSAHVNPYLLMEPTAIASLDAVRAAQSFLLSQHAVATSKDLYVWGHSQGAQAAEFVTALSPLYAPEYTLKAVAPVSPPSDLIATAQANFTGATPSLGLGEGIAYAWSDYYNSAALSTALLPPWSTMALTELQNYCKSGYTDPLSTVKDPTTVFAPPFLSGITQGAMSEPWSCWLHYNNPATMGPQLGTNVPMLYVTGAADTTVYPSANDPVFTKWCAQGVQMEYLQCTGADHVHSVSVSIDNVLSFFDDRKNGVALPTDFCQIKPATKCASAP